VYARQVGDKVLTFGVSGMLFRDGLVMFDRETDTLWTHVDGRAIKGALKGRVLEIVPSVHATWKEWKTLYPESVVLKKNAVFRSPYESYNRDNKKVGVLGRRIADTRLPTKERIVGVRSADATMAFPEKAVRAARLVQAAVGSVPVVLVAAGETLPIVTFDRRVEKHVLSFRVEPGTPPTLVDTETSTRWRISDGAAIDGPLKGRRLTRATAYPAFWFGWISYFPSTGLWTGR
jgi:hypothetical protein